MILHCGSHQFIRRHAADYAAKPNSALAESQSRIIQDDIERKRQPLGCLFLHVADILTTYLKNCTILLET